MRTEISAQKSIQLKTELYVVTRHIKVDGHTAMVVSGTSYDKDQASIDCFENAFSAMHQLNKQ